MSQDRKERATKLAKEIVEKTLPHLSQDEETIRVQADACAKWSDSFLLAVEKLLKGSL